MSKKKTTKSSVTTPKSPKEENIERINIGEDKVSTIRPKHVVDDELTDKIKKALTTGNMCLQRDLDTLPDHCKGQKPIFDPVDVGSWIIKEDDTPLANEIENPFSTLDEEKETEAKESEILNLFRKSIEASEKRREKRKEELINNMTNFGPKAVNLSNDEAVRSPRKLKSPRDISDEENIKAHVKEVVETKRYIKKHKEEIDVQIGNMVAFYNIGDKNAFYFVTPAEARIAIEHIKAIRDDEVKSFVEDLPQDTIVRKCIQSLLNTKNQKSFDKNIDVFEKVFQTIEAPLVAYPNIDHLKTVDFEKYMTVLKEEEVKFEEGEEIDSLIFDLPTITIFKLKKNNKRKVSIDDVTFDKISDIFYNIGKYDTTVDVVIMHPNTFFANEKLWPGITSYSPKDICQREKENKVRCVGSLLTSEVYISNLLKENQVIVGTLLQDYDKGLFINAIL